MLLFLLTWETMQKHISWIYQLIYQIFNWLFWQAEQSQSRHDDINDINDELIWIW